MDDPYSKADWLLMSYDLEYLLEDNDITEHYILQWLIENSMIELDKYFDEEE